MRVYSVLVFLSRNTKLLTNRFFQFAYLVFIFLLP